VCGVACRVTEEDSEMAVNKYDVKNLLGQARQAQPGGTHQFELKAIIDKQLKDNQKAYSGDELEMLREAQELCGDRNRLLVGGRRRNEGLDDDTGRCRKSVYSSIPYLS
jgi:hypothetical protein